MPDFDFVKYEPQDDGTIVRIILNRPEARNAQNRGMLVELNEAFLAAEADDNVRVVILSGEGKMFSSGHDLGSKVAMAERRGGEHPHPTSETNGGTRIGAESLMLQEWHYFFENTRRWRNLRKITIAQVHGDVYSAGLMLMWACDLIVGADDVRFADVVGTRLGMCGMEYFAHPWEFGARKTKELMLTGDSITVHEAYALGMVSKVFPGAELNERTLEFARRIARVPTMAALMIKGVGEPDPGQSGLLHLAQRVLHAARVEPRALGPGQRRPLPDRERGRGRAELEDGAPDRAVPQRSGDRRIAQLGPTSSGQAPAGQRTRYFGRSPRKVA